MSEEVLWYAARVSGLLAWILSFGALAAGLLARSEPAHGTSAGLWAAESRNLLGRLSLVALLVHGAATASAERFGLQLTSVLTGRQDGQWLVTAIVVGVVCGWALLALELTRLVVRRLPSGGDLVLLAAATAVVAAGAYHGWQIGSDTQNPLAIAVVCASGLLLLGAAAIGLTSLFDGQDSLSAAPPAIVADGDDPVLGVEIGVADGEANPAERLASTGPAAFDAGVSVSLSRTVNQLAPDPQDAAYHHYNGGAAGTEPPAVPNAPGAPSSAFDRGPEIASARDVTAFASGHGPDQNGRSGQNERNDQTGRNGQNGRQAAPQPEDETPGSWSMRQLPDAPKPAHRKPGKN